MQFNESMSCYQAISGRTRFVVFIELLNIFWLLNENDITIIIKGVNDLSTID